MTAKAETWQRSRSSGGQKSAKKRFPTKLIATIRKLHTTGDLDRSSASILARRFGKTPDYVRGLIHDIKTGAK